MPRGARLLVVFVSTLLLAHCAHMTPHLDDVKIGMRESEAAEHLRGDPTPTYFSSGSTSYVLYHVFASLFSGYSEHPYTVLFVRFENGVVVDKGVVGRREEKRIQQINPGFDLKKSQRHAGGEGRWENTDG